MPSVTIKFSQIDQNPYRDLVGNALTDERIEQLAASIEQTDFWDNVLVRKHPTKTGRYQLAYGHARIEAAKLAGLREADFQVRNLDEADMVRVMTAENVTQFGKDSYATYKEAVVAAVTVIMLETLEKPDRAAKFFHTKCEKENINRMVRDIASGGHPGHIVIANFFRRQKDGHPDPDAPTVLGVGDIKLALQTLDETGEIAAWHVKHNPKAKLPKADPTINPVAVAKFTKTHHVKSFTEAIKVQKVPYDQQPKIADNVLASLKDNTSSARKKAPVKARTSWDSSVGKDERMTGANIRTAVGKQVYASSRTKADRERADAIAKMTTAERALSEICAGLSRAESGFHSLIPLVTYLGSLETELTPLALNKLRDIKLHMEKIDEYMKKCRGVILPRIKQEA